MSSIAPRPSSEPPAVRAPEVRDPEAEIAEYDDRRRGPLGLDRASLNFAIFLAAMIVIGYLFMP